LLVHTDCQRPGATAESDAGRGIGMSEAVEVVKRMLRVSAAVAALLAVVT
jgi:hypothetical protein